LLPARRAASSDTILKRLATYIEKAVKLSGQVKSAMVYPVAVVVNRRRGRRLILWKVIPTFAELFSGLGADLPLATRVVIGAQQQPGPVFPVSVRRRRLDRLHRPRYYATAKGRRVIDRTLLHMPVLGNILRKIAVARFCRTLSTLISSGVPILDGLEITAKTSGNSIVEDAVMVTRKSIERGETIAVPLKETKVFPAMVTQMIGVGEATGALDTMLSKIADFYEEEVDVAVAGPVDAARADHDRGSRRDRRRHRHRDVFADLRFDQQIDLGSGVWGLGARGVLPVPRPSLQSLQCS
jgi:type IV pilus assembly protein PilC